jgi:hypothetical protein
LITQALIVFALYKRPNPYIPFSSRLRALVEQDL